jgi:hypothetical protein
MKVTNIEEKLFLKVNRAKTVVDYVGKVKFLGFTFYTVKGVTRIRIHPKSVVKMKGKIKELTARSNGWGNEFRTDSPILSRSLGNQTLKNLGYIFFSDYYRQVRVN